MTAPRPDYTEALDRILACVAAPDETEAQPLPTCGGRTLAEPVVADRDLPPFHRAQMDGYALRGAEVGRIEVWPVAGHIAAGTPPDIAVPPGACVAIATGAPLPADVDTVIQHELSDRADPVRFTIDHIETGHAVHGRGSDAVAGDVLIPDGTVLGAHHLGIAASAGRAALTVIRRPRARVITSGDEVRPAGTTVAAHQIRNSNAPMLVELLTRMDAEVRGHEHAPDDIDTTTAAVGRGLDDADLLVTVGGVSAGDRDHFRAAFETHGIETVQYRAAIQPGGPIFLGRHPAGAIVVGLPGNPVSTLACACLFAWPILRRLSGAGAALDWQPHALGEPVRANPRRRAFRPCALRPDGTIVIPAWAGSGDLAHTAATHGLAELPVQAEAVERGTVVRFLKWP